MLLGFIGTIRPTFAPDEPPVYTIDFFTSPFASATEIAARLSVARIPLRKPG